MRTIALVSSKGGAGKSTLASNLAVRATETGERVIALDLDQQASLAAWTDDRVAENIAVGKITGDKIAKVSEILAALSEKGFSLAILDCPGVAGSITNGAMRAADLCLIPCRPTRLDLRATKPTVEALMLLKRPYTFILSQGPATRSSRVPEAAAGLAMLGDVCPVYIAQRTDYQDAFAAGLGVTEFAPNGKAAEEIRGLWSFIVKKIGKSDGKAP